jgi:hypothetical protein
LGHSYKKLIPDFCFLALMFRISSLSACLLALCMLAGCASVPRERVIAGVMVENHQGARPHHRGLDKALMIQEFLVEGGISRFLVLFDRGDLPPIIGPVRSLRPYFADGAEPWASVLFFAGGSPEAFDRLQTVKNLDWFNGLSYAEFERDETVDAPHNLFLSGENVQKLSSGSLLRPVLWPPYPTGRMKDKTDASSVKLNFYSRVHNVAYTYDPSSNTYTRVNGQVTEAMRPANVVVLEAAITAIGEKGRLTIPLESGKLLLFRSGTVFEGTWRKVEHGPWEFLDEDGKPLLLASGQTWLTVLPDLRRVTWAESNP